MYAGEAKKETNPFLAGIAALSAANEVELWPENEQAIMLFSSLGTQWRVGMNGPTGMDYNVVYHKLDRMNLSPTDYGQLEDDMRVIEREALRIMNKSTD